MKIFILVLCIAISSCSLLQKDASIETGGGCIKGQYDKHSGQYCKE